VALVASAWLAPRGRGEGAALDALAAQVAALRESLARESREREVLGDELGRLRAELEALRRPDGVARAPERVIAPAPTAAAPAPDAAPQPAAGGVAPEGLDVAALLAAGFARDEVERFRERVDAIELERLYLRDQAAREGWLGTSRFQQESRRLDAAMNGLRGEFDEELYDWMLFASGRPNRVEVTEVLADSAAAEAGLRPGDVLVRYDDRLVLTPLELREATAGGEAGSWVAVEVQRGGESVRVLLPRGPLGVRLEPRVLQPSPAG
jgi:hypothetical protein